MLLLGCGQDPIVAAARPGAFVPRPMVRTIVVQVARSTSQLFLRARWLSERGDRQAYFEYAGGAWEAHGGGFRTDEGTANPAPVAEVSLGVALSARAPENGVRQFSTAGCFVACHDSSSRMPNWRSEDGEQTMRLLGGFGAPVDLWTWRADRTARSGVADDGLVSVAGRASDEGRAAWQDLSLSGGNPPFVLDPASAGAFAGTEASVPTFGDAPGVSVPLLYATAIERGYVPMKGDVVPAQLLLASSGSVADVAASASYDGSGWDLRLTRALDTGDAVSDVKLATGSLYDLAFSLHTGNSDGRDHYVSLPVSLSLDPSGSDLDATAGDAAPDFTDETTYPPRTIELFLPGVTSYESLVGAIVTREGAVRTDDVGHGGALEVSAGSHACMDCHRVASTDAAPPYRQVGALERLVLRRGGVFGPTPTFEATP